MATHDAKVRNLANIVWRLIEPLSDALDLSNQKDDTGLHHLEVICKLHLQGGALIPGSIIVHPLKRYY